MSQVIIYISIFVGLAVFFLFFHLLLGTFIRPIEPDEEKLTIYECGEPTIGSAWIQFDLRYYVVALLFVIFDVEVAFFFPWAIVFGKANTLAEAGISTEERVAITKQLAPEGLPAIPGVPQVAEITAEASKYMAWIGFVDILIFFSVLIIGFAYLWKRGDIDWVRSVRNDESSRQQVSIPPEKPQPTEAGVLVGSGQG